MIEPGLNKNRSVRRANRLNHFYPLLSTWRLHSDRQIIVQKIVPGSPDSCQTLTIGTFIAVGLWSVLSIHLILTLSSSCQTLLIDKNTFFFTWTYSILICKCVCCKSIRIYFLSLHQYALVLSLSALGSAWVGLSWSRAGKGGASRLSAGRQLVLLGAPCKPPWRRLATCALLWAAWWCKKQDHQRWRYHRRLLNYQSPYFLLIIEKLGIID